MILTADNLADLAQVAITAARQAGEVIADYTGTRLEVQTKPSGDNLAAQVVTEVDLHAEAIIIETLQPTLEQFDLGLLSEEQGDDGARLAKDYFWCIDPIDGTLSFIEGGPGYAVSIALVSNAGESQLGVVYDPLSGQLYSAIKGQGAMRNDQPWSLPSASPQTGKPLTLARDHSLEKRPDYSQLLRQLEGIAARTGASGLRILPWAGAVMNGCWVLENRPACYFKFPKPQQGGGSLWDFAAITCLFQELGAIATDFAGLPLELNNTETTFMNRRGVLFTTDQALADEIQGLDLEA